jgi:hypothetical protein
MLRYLPLLPEQFQSQLLRPVVLQSQEQRRHPMLRQQRPPHPDLRLMLPRFLSQSQPRLQLTRRCR